MLVSFLIFVAFLMALVIGMAMEREKEHEREQEISPNRQRKRPVRRRPQLALVSHSGQVDKASTHQAPDHSVSKGTDPS